MDLMEFGTIEWHVTPEGRGTTAEAYPVVHRLPREKDLSKARAVVNGGSGRRSFNSGVLFRLLQELGIGSTAAQLRINRLCIRSGDRRSEPFLVVIRQPAEHGRSIPCDK
jgi:hypothetical protein